jgi:hypothetical protein
MTVNPHNFSRIGEVLSIGFDTQTHVHVPEREPEPFICETCSLPVRRSGSLGWKHMGTHGNLQDDKHQAVPRSR